MHYQDFNGAGDKNHIFNPMDLVTPMRRSAGNSDDGMHDLGDNFIDGSFLEDIDEFTKKRMPKEEDFIISQDLLKHTQKKGKKKKKV